MQNCTQIQSGSNCHLNVMQSPDALQIPLNRLLRPLAVGDVPRNAHNTYLFAPRIPEYRSRKKAGKDFAVFAPIEDLLDPLILLDRLLVNRDAFLRIRIKDIDVLPYNLLQRVSKSFLRSLIKLDNFP